MRRFDAIRVRIRKARVCGLVAKRLPHRFFGFDSLRWLLVVMYSCVTHGNANNLFIVNRLAV